MNIRAKCCYLYWACFRGRVDLVKHILEKDKISPFYRIYEGRSPIMACIIGKHAPMDVSSPHAVQQPAVTFSFNLVFDLALCNYIA